ncbi:MAG: response regulator [Candidatus Peregrinibacteria bacterium]|nr:response regulator [Candidatus Peregrinibacteria bacterium]
MSSTILVAEDDAFFRETIQLALEEHGMTVKTAKHGGEAIDMIEEAQPDLLLLDLLMPHTDGFAVLSHIRSKHYAFPVVILSNLSEDIDNDKCLSLGARDYFVKSAMDEDEIWPMIQQYLTVKR